MLFRDFHTIASEKDFVQGQPLPGLKKDTLNFVADQQKSGARLKVTINATYSGYLLNRRVYPGKYVRMHDCYGDWCSKANGGTASYDKPVLTHHNDEGEPIGRVVASKFVQLWEDSKLLRDYTNPVMRYDQGSGYIQIVAVISDAAAIEKILDGRYNTVSSSQNSDVWLCSICGKNYKDSEPCAHVPGEHYEVSDKKRLCYAITGKLQYNELSYVNIPANANAVTVAKELSDSMKDKADYVGMDNALKYQGVVLVDSQGHEIDLSNQGGENFPGVRTQVHISSDIDLDKLMESAPVAFPDSVEDALDAGTFAIGNMVRSMVDAGQMEDGPMNGMVSYFKAITAKADGHQHIVYLELDIENRRLQGGTEYTSKGEMHRHSVDLEVPDLNAKNFNGETRDADRGDHHVHGFEFDMVTDRAPQVSLADALKAARMVDEYFHAGKLTDHQLACLAMTDEERQKVDSKLTTAQRKKLKESTFCGPDRSFPVPDCAHVTAARRLIGRFKGSVDTKARILACVNQRAQTLGCGKEDSTDTDPYGMLHKNEEPAMKPENQEKTPAGDAAQKTLRDQFAGLKDAALLDKAVELAESLDAKNRQIVDLTAEKDALRQKHASLEASNKTVTDENVALRQKLHLNKARELGTMRLVLGQLQADSVEKFEEAVKKLAERTEASLEDAIKDASPAFQTAIKNKTPAADFLRDKPEGGDPTVKNGDQTGDKGAAKKVVTEQAGNVDRKAEAAKKI